MVGERTIDKYKREAEEAGRETWFLFMNCTRSINNISQQRISKIDLYVMLTGQEITSADDEQLQCSETFDPNHGPDDGHSTTFRNEIQSESCSNAEGSTS